MLRPLLPPSELVNPLALVCPFLGGVCEVAAELGGELFFRDHAEAPWRLSAYIPPSAEFGGPYAGAWEAFKREGAVPLYASEWRGACRGEPPPMPRLRASYTVFLAPPPLLLRWRRAGYLALLTYWARERGVRLPPGPLSVDFVRGIVPGELLEDPLRYAGCRDGEGRSLAPLVDLLYFLKHGRTPLLDAARGSALPVLPLRRLGRKVRRAE